MLTSFHTGFLGNYSVLDAISRVRDAGYDGVELNAETLPWTSAHVDPQMSPEVRRAIAATESVSSIAAHRAGLASSDLDLRRNAIEWTIGCAQLAVDLGTDIIHVIPGDASGESTLNTASEPGVLPAFVDSLRTVVHAAEPLGVRVGIEPIVNQLIADTSGAEYLMAEVTGLGISFDPSHLEVTTHDVDDAARRLGPQTFIAAIKDARGTPSDFTFPTLGTGDIDFVSMLRILRESGFDGYLVVEHEAHVFGDSKGPDEVLPESLAFLQAQIRASLNQAGVPNR